MSLYENWKQIAYRERDPESDNTFWGEYLPKEQVIYEEILGNVENTISGKLSVLAKKYDMDCETFVGFMDGINTSLKELVDLDTLEKDSEIALDVDFEKLYYNMLDANADWLYNLPQWASILTDSERKEIKKAYNKTKIVVKDPKIGRNDPCPCGSGRKYKQCCMNK